MPMRRLLLDRRLQVLMIGTVVFAGVVGLRLAGQLETLELAAYDWYVRARPEQAVGPPRVSLVTVTEDDIQHLGRYPLPHGLLAEAIERIVAHGPRAVGIDIYLDVPIPPGRERLEAALLSHDNVYVVTKFTGDGETGARAPSVLADTDRVGFNDLMVDPGGTVRRGLLFLDDGEKVYSAIALRLALRYLAADGMAPAPDPANPAHIRLGGVTLAPLDGHEGGYVAADAGGYQFLLDYRDPVGAFPSISLGELLSGNVDGDVLRDRVVLLGVSAQSVKDLFYTPLSRDLERVGQTNGVEVHANIVSQLIRHARDGDPAVRSLSDAGEATWILAWCLAGALLGLATASPLRFLLLATLSAGAIAAGTFAAFLASWWIPLVPPLLGWGFATAIATAYVSSRDKQEQASLMSLFSRHISPQLAGAIWSERDRFLSGDRPQPRKLTATVFFSDVAGFTTISESLDPGELMRWLNEYMALMTPQVNRHGGVILRFIGDAIMAVFGVPVPRDSDEAIRRDAVAAVECALQMQRELVSHNHSLAQRGLPQVGMRVGILTGPMVAGTIGDAQRMEYNVHGDTVNTAARLESFDKASFRPDPLHTPCRILVGETTAGYLGDAYVLEKVGEELFRGKTRPVAVFRVHGRKEEAQAPRPPAIGVRAG